MVDSNELKPQQALEKILQLEIEIAEKIAVAKEEAEQKVAATQNKTTHLKDSIIEDAREERDRKLEEGIAKVRQKADERVELSSSEAEQFVKMGRRYENKAAEHVLELILRIDKQEDK